MVDTIRSLTVRGKSEGLGDLEAKLRAVKSAQDGVVQSGAGLNTANANSEKGALAAGRAFETLVNRLDPVSRASATLEKQLNTAFRAFDLGEASISEVNNVLAMASANLEKVAAAASKIDQSALNNLLGVQEGVATSARDSASAFEAARRESEMLDAALAQTHSRQMARLEEQQAYELRIASARAAQNAESNQAAFSQFMGVTADPRGSQAKGSAGAFQDEQRAQEEAAKQAQAEYDLIERARQEQEAKVASRSQSNDAFFDKRDAQQMAEFSRLEAQAAAEAAAKQDMLAKSANALKAALDPVGYAIDINAQELAHYNELLAAGLIDQQRYDQAQAASASKLATVKRNYGGDSAANASKLAGNQFTNLGYQLNDVISGFAMGQSPMTIITQQGGQVYQALASAQGGIAGGMQAVTARAASFIGGMSAVTGILGGVSIAAIAAAAAYSRLASSQREVQLALSGAGRASGTTASQIQDIAHANASAGGITDSQARSLAAGAAQTGKIGPDIFPDLIKSAKAYSVVIGEDVPAAGQKLIAALADPAKGADDLNAIMGGLDDRTKQLIISLQASGDRAGAQRVLMDTFSASIKAAGENISGTTRALDTASRAWSFFWENVGKGAEIAMKGGITPEEQIASLRAQLESMKAAGNSGFMSLVPDAFKSSSLQAVQDALDKLLATQAKVKVESEQAAKAQRSQEVGNIVRANNADPERLKKLQQDAENIRTGLNSVAIDEQGRSARTMDGLLAQAKQLKEDMAAGGAAFADAVRNAQYALKTVDFSSQGKSLADVNKRAEDAQRALDRSNPNASDRLAQLYSIEQTRQAELATAQRQITTGAAQQGGAFSRAPEDVQQMMLSAAEKTGISVDRLAAIIEKESSFNATAVPRRKDGSLASSAYGYGQLTDAAAADAGVNKLDPAQNILGTARYYMQQMARFGDPTLAASAYNQGAGNARTPAGLSYAADVQRREGTMGDASSTGQSRTLDANARAVDEQNKLVEINTKYLGTNAEELDKQTRLRQLEAGELAKGVVVSDDYRKSLAATAGGLASAAQQLKMVSFTKDIAFEGSQLGRNSNEAAVYARVKSTFGDTTSDASKAAIALATANDNMKVTKDITNDMFKGIGQDLLNATSAADAAHNAFNRLASKLLDMGIDNIVSKLFGAVAGAGGSGGGGIMQSILGAFGGGATGNTVKSALGNIVGSDGAMPLHRYASGGIARTAQMAMFGEGDHPEAYVPLPDGRSIPVTMRMGAAANTPVVPMTAQTVVHNYGDQNVQTKTTQTPQGPRTDVVIGRKIGAYLLSPEAAPLRKQLGINRMTSGR